MNQTTTYLDRRYLFVRRERLYDARDRLEHLCLFRILYARQARMQLSKRCDMRCERDPVRIAQIAQRVGGGETQAHLAERRRDIAQDGEQRFPRVCGECCEPGCVGTLSDVIGNPEAKKITKHAPMRPSTVRLIRWPPDTGIWPRTLGLKRRERYSFGSNATASCTDMIQWSVASSSCDGRCVSSAYASCHDADLQSTNFVPLGQSICKVSEVIRKHIIFKDVIANDGGQGEQERGNAETHALISVSPTSRR